MTVPLEHLYTVTPPSAVELAKNEALSISGGLPQTAVNQNKFPCLEFLLCDIFCNYNPFDH